MYVAIGLELKHISYARQFRRRVPIFFCNFPAEAEAEKAVPRAVVDVFGHLSLLPLFAKVNDLEAQTFPSQALGLLRSSDGWVEGSTTISRLQSCFMVRFQSPLLYLPYLVDLCQLLKIESRGSFLMWRARPWLG